MTSFEPCGGRNVPIDKSVPDLGIRRGLAVDGLDPSAAFPGRTNGRPINGQALNGTPHIQIQPASAEGLRQRLYSTDLSLGYDVVRANGLNPNSKGVVIAHNLLAGLSGYSELPIHVDPTPELNNSCSLLALSCLGPGESCLSLPPQPGLLEYYRSRGILDASNQIFAVAPATHNFSSGYPKLDLLALAKARGLVFDDQYFVSAFTSSFIRKQATELGLAPVQRSDSFLTNDKSALRHSGEKFGFAVLPGLELENQCDLDQAVERFRDIRVWVKFSHSWGGDLVFPVDAPLTHEKLLRARDRLRSEIEKGFSLNQYGSLSLDDYWPKDKFSPSQCSIVLEADASSRGEVLVNGSNVMVVDRTGATNIRGYFKQLTTNGVFHGSVSFDPASELSEMTKLELDAMMLKVGRYCATDLNLYGLVGVDFMLIRPHEDPSTVVPVVLELNGRPPISACSFIAANKLEANNWISRDIAAPFPIHSMRDFERLVTFSGKNYARNEIEDGIIFPLMIDSIYASIGSSSYALAHSAKTVKLLIAGESMEQCAKIQKELSSHHGLNWHPFARDNTVV